jgi:Putative beta-barrel porin-2, OmpL-like. bbp2
MFFARRTLIQLLLLLLVGAFSNLGRAALWAHPSPDGVAPAGNSPAGSSPKSASAEERISSLEETIRGLEARLRELEGRGSASQDNGKTTEAVIARGANGSSAEPAAADPAPPAGNRVSFFDKVEFSGFVDTYYGYNFNRPPSRKNPLRNFDLNHNQFSLNLIELAMERKADPLGFRLDLNFGDTAKFVHAAEPGGSDVYQYLQQAYVTYKAPLGKGLSVDFGKFVTHMGAEVIETPSNNNYSRSLLFSWAIPYYHFGTRVSYPLSDKLTVAGLLVNGWNDVVDNNGGKSVGVSVNITPFKRLNLIQNYIVGAEQLDNSDDRRHVLDTVLTVNASDRLSLMFNYDYGMDRLQGERVRWQGVAGYFRFAFTPWFAIAPRVEWYDDPQGFTTGLAQTLKEATFTMEFKARGALLMRAEYRGDWSDRPFFEKRSGALSRSQTTATLGLVYLMGQER